MKVTDFKRKKQLHEKIVMLTCYDYPSAVTLSEVEPGPDCVLVGDSVAMTVHGHETTVMATMEMMVMHTKAVARGIKHQFIVSDLPFLSHKLSLTDTVNNVRQLMQAGAHAIKMEGGDEDTCRTIAHLVSAGVPIMGHIGLTPQSVYQLGGYKVQGREERQAALLIEQAKRLEAAGCLALVIECVPQTLAKAITQAIAIPTIGIGAGVETDGQVLVWHDMLGLQNEIRPKFVKQYAQGKSMIQTAICDYVQQVKKSQFPALEHAF